MGGHNLAASIANEYHSLVLTNGIPDKIMFTWAANWEFSIKRAYQMLENLQGTQRRMVPDWETTIWKKIWKLTGVAPRVRMFFWRLISGALPTSQASARRILAIDAQCKLCQDAVEDAFHAIFDCPHARATWFMSPLGLRIMELSQMPMREIISDLWTYLDSQQIALFMSLAWHIWKNRCYELFQDKQCVPERALRMATADAGSQPPLGQVLRRVCDYGAALSRGEVETQLLEGYCAWSDGSFGPKDQGGGAFLLWNKGYLVRYELKDFNSATSPFHMEVMALLLAARFADLTQIEQCFFLTDCKLLADILDPRRKFQLLQAADWRSYSELMQIVTLFRRHRMYCCRFISREDNGEAHKLANRARCEQFSYCGFTLPTFSDK